MALLSVRAAAERLGVSAALVYALCATRKIRHERHGLRRGRIKIPEEAIEEYRQGVTIRAAGAAQTAVQPRPAVRLKHLRARGG